MLDLMLPLLQLLLVLVMLFLLIKLFLLEKMICNPQLHLLLHQIFLHLRHPLLLNNLLIEFQTATILVSRH
jgi:hypothetical protein